MQYILSNSHLRQAQSYQLRLGEMGIHHGSNSRQARRAKSRFNHARSPKATKPPPERHLSAMLESRPLNRMQYILPNSHLRQAQSYQLRLGEMGSGQKAKSKKKILVESIIYTEMIEPEKIEL